MDEHSFRKESARGLSPNRFVFSHGFIFTWPVSSDIRFHFLKKLFPRITVFFFLTTLTLAALPDVPKHTLNQRLLEIKNDFHQQHDARN